MPRVPQHWKILGKDCNFPLRICFQIQVVATGKNNQK